MIRRANIDDIFRISKLYYHIYGDQYPDRTVYDFAKMESQIQDPSLFWIIAEDDNHSIVGSVIYIYEKEDLLSKVYAACVHPDYRGKNLTQKMMEFGEELVRETTNGLDILYATTRTLNPSAQKLTEKQGFKKLGIFPNVHKTSRYETHGLVTKFSESCFSKRFTDYLLHPEIESIYNLTTKETNQPSLSVASEYKAPQSVLCELPFLEIIKAPEFVKRRYKDLKQEKELQLEFFPFHQANILISNPEQTTQIFVNMASDGYCAILGGKVENSTNYCQLMLKIADMLRDYGARYLELIIRADQIDILDHVLKARFIPSAFFPAFQLIGGKRYDFVVFSRSFEIFDFQNVELEGINQEYLSQYYEHWKRVALTPKLITHEN